MFQRRGSQRRVEFPNLLQQHLNHKHLAAAGATDDSSLGSFNLESNTEHDADIDEEYSDGITTQDDGGESTEPEQPDRTMYFGQAVETPG